MRKWIPAALFAASAVIFGICAVLQILYASLLVGVIFAILALLGLSVFIALRTGRITW